MFTIFISADVLLFRCRTDILVKTLPTSLQCVQPTFSPLTTQHEATHGVATYWVLFDVGLVCPGQNNGGATQWVAKLKTRLSALTGCSLCLRYKSNIPQPVWIYILHTMRTSFNTSLADMNWGTNCWYQVIKRFHRSLNFSLVFLHWEIWPQTCRRRHLLVPVPPGTAEECYEETTCVTLFTFLLNHRVYTTHSEDEGGRYLETRFMG